MHQQILQEAIEGKLTQDWRVKNSDIEPASELLKHIQVEKQQPLTRFERVKQVKKCDYFTKYGEQTRKVLETLLDKYADEGIENIEDMKILQVKPLDALGSPLKLLGSLGVKWSIYKRWASWN